MDQKSGFTEEERRDFRQLYGDPWFMVQQLLGHASRETTVNHYLAPVADLQLRSMLAGASEPIAAPMPELDAVFARGARESEGIQDLDDLGHALVGGGAGAGEGSGRRCRRAPTRGRSTWSRTGKAGWSSATTTEWAGSASTASHRCRSPRRCSTRWRSCPLRGARRTAGPRTPRLRKRGGTCSG